MHRRVIEIIRVVFWLLSVGALVRTVILLAAIPNLDPGVYTTFIGPVFACLFLIANTGRFDSIAVRGCELFLGMIAVAVLIGEQPFLLRNLKPLFPGLPPQANRVLFCYVIAHGLFMWIICPGYVFGHSLRLRLRGQPGGMSKPILYAGLVCWIGTIAVLVFIFATSDQFF